MVLLKARNILLHDNIMAHFSFHVHEWIFMIYTQLGRGEKRQEFLLNEE